MAGRHRGGKALTVAEKRRRFFAHRAAGGTPHQQLAEMCDWLKAAAAGRPDRAVEDAARRVRDIVEGLDT